MLQQALGMLKAAQICSGPSFYRGCSNQNWRKPVLISILCFGDEMKVAEFFFKIQNRNEHLRKGQAAFNLLSEINPELAQEIVGSENDCFYDDSKLGYLVNLLVGRGVLE